MTASRLQKPVLWLVLCVSLVAVLFLTALKDWWLTAQPPNAAFYFFIPIMNITAEVLVIWGAARLIRRAIALLDVLAIIIVAAILMQLAEIILKLIYYLFWSYPGILYLLITIPLSVGIVSYALIKWCHLSIRNALFLAVVGFLGGSAVTALFSTITGIYTPGS